MKKLLLICMFSVWLLPTAIAQRQVTGTAIDFADRQPLPGVNVLIEGTSSGTVTDIDGNYAIEVSGDEAVLVFSFIGYESHSEVVGNRSVIDVSLMSDIQQLGEVVVTALGIEREKKALGYSVTEVQGESLTQARENNVTNALVGKVAGLNVNATSGGVGASSNIVIRGVSSISQSSQPLYVINGVPVESQPNANVGSQWDNAPDLGDAISNINPDDIESISVLKGAAASALYGYRAKAGVVLITTKGAKGGAGITFNSNYVAEEVINLTDFQYVYGHGSNNEAPASAGEAMAAARNSWGAKLDGSMVPQFDGVERPYVAQKDNLKNFYRTGGTWTNTIAFNKAFEGGGIRFSASNLDNKSIVPNSGLDRQTFDLSGTFEPIKGLTIDGRANYIIEKAKNRPFLNDGPGNANHGAMFLPTSLDVRTLNPGINEDGSERVYSNDIWATNPWFAANQFVNNTTRKRLISSVTARYDFDNGLFIQGRAANDHYSNRYTAIVPKGTGYRPGGQIVEMTTDFNDINVDGLVGKNFSIGDKFNVNPILGASYRRTESYTFRSQGDEILVAGIESVANANTVNTTYSTSDLEVQSLYTSIEFSYDELLYLTVTGRQDWFSTLATPGFDNELGVFYPGVSGSFVFSQLLNSDALSFGKLRFGYAMVGQATDPYNTQLYYSLLGPLLNGIPLAVVKNPSTPNPNLVASEAKEFEIGTDIRFLNNRISLDLTYYNKVSENEILSSPASTTSGYSGAILNAGKMSNKGIEALLSVTPVETSDFSWMSSVNGAYNKNEIESLAEDATLNTIATSRSGNGFISNMVGKPFGQIMATDYMYDAEGNIVVDPSSGVPVKGELKAFGTAYHPLTAGWNNEFSYKRFNFGFLIDGKWGAKIFSGTDYYAYIFGLHKETLPGREGDAPWGTNTQASTYYSSLANNVSKLFVEDASFVKFRQLTLGYSVPTSIFNDKISSLTISLVGRNLFYIMRKTDNIDPEGNYTALAQGLELGGVPPMRSYGINLNIKL